MLPYNINNFANDLNVWINARFLPQIPDNRWGWQGWIQADFPAWIDNNNQNQFDFYREFQVPNTQNRIDWAININNLQGNQTVYVEIRTQTPMSGNNFINDVQHDINRLNQFFPQQGINNKLILAAVIDQNAVAPLVAQGFIFTAADVQNLVHFYTLFW